MLRSIHFRTLADGGGGPENFLQVKIFPPEHTLAISIVCDMKVYSIHYNVYNSSKLGELRAFNCSSDKITCLLVQTSLDLDYCKSGF